jgi:hypothetical protein
MRDFALGILGLGLGRLSLVFGLRGLFVRSLGFGAGFRLLAG